MSVVLNEGGNILEFLAGSFFPTTHSRPLPQDPGKYSLGKIPESPGWRSGERITASVKAMYKCPETLIALPTPYYLPAGAGLGLGKSKE